MCSCHAFLAELLRFMMSCFFGVHSYVSLALHREPVNFCSKRISLESESIW